MSWKTYDTSKNQEKLHVSQTSEEVDLNPAKTNLKQQETILQTVHDVADTENIFCDYETRKEQIIICSFVLFAFLFTLKTETIKDGIHKQKTAKTQHNTNTTTCTHNTNTTQHKNT